jgi:omega-amidase
MKIGLAQITCAVGDIPQNCSKIADFSRRAKEQGCDVVIFPEMTDTGYVPEVIARTARTWREEPYQTASACASALSLYLVCGLSEREGTRIFNSVAVFSPVGELLGKYRKLHLFSPAPVCEDKCFSPGNALTLVEIGGLKWGFSICYDLRFPEMYRALTVRGAEVLVNCTAWPTLRPAPWDCLPRARAIENQAYFVGVNRVGADGEISFCGRSRMVDPFGEISAEGSAEREELVVGELAPEKISECRRAIPALQSRRSDVYGEPGAA